jgi:GT2 family glycosyltransferase
MGRRVRVVVLNYNGGEHVVRCVDALAALDWPRRGGGDGGDRERREVEVVLVDNASTDGSVEAVLDAHPGVRLIQTGSNLGFVANNLALRHLGGVDYVALLNNDAFVEPGWLTPLVDALDADPGLGAVQSRILFADRFVEIDIAPEIVRSVELGGMRLDGADRFAGLQVATGGGEPRTSGSAIVHPLTGPATVRVPIGSGDPGAPDASDGATAELLLSSATAGRVGLTCGAHEVAAPIGPTPTWVSVALVGEAMRVVNNVGGVVTTDGHGTDRGWLEPDRGQFDEPAEIFAWCGGSVLLRPSYLAEVGLLDEELFLYYEDTDLSWRGRARGWRYRYEPRSIVHHLHAASSGTASTVFRYYNERNRLIVLVRNAPGAMAWRAALRHPLSTLSYARRDILTPLLSGRRPDLTMVRVRLSAYGGFLVRLPAALVARRRIRRAATVPDTELTGWFVDPGGAQPAGRPDPSA